MDFTTDKQIRELAEKYERVYDSYNDCMYRAERRGDVDIAQHYAGQLTALKAIIKDLYKLVGEDVA